jgi:hypothetical protein
VTPALLQPVIGGYDHDAGHRSRGVLMKKLLVLLILVAIGVAVARKVREA